MNTSGPNSLRWRWEKAIRDDPRLNRTEKLVAFALQSRMDKDGFCWLTVERLKADTGLGERAIQYALYGREERHRPGLVGFGYLDVKGKGGRQIGRAHVRT